MNSGIISIDTEMIAEERIHVLISAALPNLETEGMPEPIEGGNLNHVWRLKGKPHNIIVKWAPPYIAANPEIPLSPDRIHFEAQALNLFKEGHPLHSLISSEIRPPRIMGYSVQDNLLLMEDLGNIPSIDEWFSKSENSSAGLLLGQFIGALHRETIHTSSLAEQFDNRDIQQTRLKLQYRQAEKYVRSAGLNTRGDLQSKTEALGDQLLNRGRCLVMGDLWPPSVLVDNSQLRLIDWEFSHYGRPLQDVAHFAAHCWMQAHTAASPAGEQKFKQLWNTFWKAYQQESENIFEQLFDEQEQKDAAVHCGTEILVRAAGPFKTGYVYESYPEDHPMITQAAQKAVILITEGNFKALWA